VIGRDLVLNRFLELAVASICEHLERIGVAFAMALANALYTMFGLFSKIARATSAARSCFGLPFGLPDWPGLNCHAAILLASRWRNFGLIGGVHAGEVCCGAIHRIELRSEIASAGWPPSASGLAGTARNARPRWRHCRLWLSNVRGQSQRRYAIMRTPPPKARSQHSRGPLIFAALGPFLQDTAKFGIRYAHRHKQMTAPIREDQ
jgi:hypothetical protein